MDPAQGALEGKSQRKDGKGQVYRKCSSRRSRHARAALSLERFGSNADIRHCHGDKRLAMTKNIPGRKCPHLNGNRSSDVQS
jgi:hypothetical protein